MIFWLRKITGFSLDPMSIGYVLFARIFLSLLKYSLILNQNLNQQTMYYTTTNSEPRLLKVFSFIMFIKNLINYQNLKGIINNNISKYNINNYITYWTPYSSSFI
jgi:hypothetical protein